METDEWVPLADYIEFTSPIVRAAFAEIDRQIVYRETRRTVAVAARKYRARRRRKR